MSKTEIVRKTIAEGTPMMTPLTIAFPMRASRLVSFSAICSDIVVIMPGVEQRLKAPGSSKSR